MVVLRLSDVSSILSCISSFQVDVVESTDSINYVSFSSVAGLVTDGHLYYLCFVEFSGIHCLLHIVQHVVFLIALELLYF